MSSLIYRFFPSYKSNFFYNSMATIGLFCLAKNAFNVCCWFTKYILPLKNDLKTKYGNGWVLITGGATGIGFNLADQLLNQNYKVCVLGKDEDQINKVVGFFEQKYPSCQVRGIIYDLNNPVFKDDEVKNLAEQLKVLDGDISVLFNNAGVNHPKMLIDQSTTEIHEILNVNLIAMTYITKVVVDIMIKRPSKSLIVGSGDLTQIFKLPGQAVYDATKNYMLSYLETIQREYPDKIDTTLLQMGPTNTDFIIKEVGDRSGIMITNVEKRAKDALSKVGKYSVTKTCLKDELFCLLFKNCFFSRTPFILMKMIQRNETEDEFIDDFNLIEKQ